MSVSELKERHAVATETVNNLRDRLIQRRLQLLDTDGFLLLFLLHNLPLMVEDILFLVFFISLCLNFDSGQVHGGARSFSGEIRSDGSSLLPYSSRTHGEGE